MGLETQHLSAALIAVIVPLVLGWLLRSASSSAKKVGGVSWLTYGVGFKGLSLFFAVIVVGLVILWFNVDAKEKAPVAGMVALFGFLTLPLLLESFFVRIGYDSVNIYCHSIWRPDRVIGWSELESVAFSESMRWWVIQTRSSGKIYVSEFISGLNDLLVELEGRGVKGLEN